MRFSLKLDSAVFLATDESGILLSFHIFIKLKPFVCLVICILNRISSYLLI